MVALFVLITFIIFIVIDIVVLKLQKKNHPALETETKAVFNRKSILIPANVFISKGHTWVEQLKDGSAKVGIDDLILKALGHITLTHIIEEGKKIKYGEVVFVGSFNGNKFNFRSPVDGIVKRINKDLTTKPLVDPFSEWSFIVEPSDIKSNLKNLKSGDALTHWLKDEFNKLKDFLDSYPIKPELAGITMHDGGNIVEGAISSINEEGLKNFETEFLIF